MSDPPRGPLLATLAVWSMPIAAAAIVAPGIGMALAVAPVSVAIAARQYRAAVLLGLGLALCAAAGLRGSVGFTSGYTAGLLAVSLAIPIGTGSARGMRYAPLVTRTSTVAGVAALVVLASLTQPVDESLHTAYEELERRIEESGDRIDAQAAEQILAIQRYTVEHWPYLLPGMLVSMILLTVALATAFAQFLARRTPAPMAPGRFRDMRPPDWLVWAAIGCVLLGFVDRESSNDAIRLIAWNGGIVLGAVYWLNGFGILVTAASRIRWPQVTIPIVVLAMLTPHLNAMLTVMGYFDTWIEFRARLARRDSAAPPDPPASE